MNKGIPTNTTSHGRKPSKINDRIDTVTLMESQVPTSQEKSIMRYMFVKT